MTRSRPTEARTEDDIIAAVLSARDRGTRLRPVGSEGSKSGINTNPGTSLHLEPHCQVRSLEGSRVTVESGIHIGRLQSYLREHSLIIPTMGEWQFATLGGTLGTATHGGSAHHGNLATSIRNIRMVTGTGDVVSLTPESPDFAHAGVSLGAMGIISTVTLECVPRFSLQLDTDVIPFRTYRQDPVAQESRSEFHASVWAPEAGRVIRYAADRAPDPARSGTREQRFGLRNAMATLLSRRLHLHVGVSNAVFRRRVVGDGSEILSPLAVSPRTAWTRVLVNEARGRLAAELAVPASRAGDALDRLEALVRQFPRALNNPLGLRMTAGDTFSLSPATGAQPTFWIDIFYDDRPAFTAALTELAVAVGARCHWGKTLALPPEILWERYPAWDAFREARARFDPAEIFANAFTDRLGLTGPASRAS